nr:hypothetical protein OG409_07760 [Streptomyces sp. NBC_00974]
MTTVIPRSAAVYAAATALISAVTERASLAPRDAAVAAYYPGHPLGSVDAIEAAILGRRARQQHGPAALPQAA